LTNLILKNSRYRQRTLLSGPRLPDNCLKETLDNASVVAIVGAEHYRLPDCLRRQASAPQLCKSGLRLNERIGVPTISSVVGQ